MNSTIKLVLPKSLRCFKSQTTIILSNNNNEKISITIPDSVVFKKETHILIFSGPTSLVTTTASLFSQSCAGLVRGFNVKLVLSGIGFKVQKKENFLEFKLGYSHNINVDLPQNINARITKNTILNLKSASKEKLGNFAAKCAGLRVPDVYKGKGIRFASKKYTLKPGKKN
jgi:large subunit ribosomal protein L6